MPTKRATLLTLAVSMVLAPLSVCAGTPDFWNVPVSGNWTDASNWSLNTVPNNNYPPATTYDVLIDTPGTYTVSLNSAITVDNLTLNSASAILALAGNPGLSANGEFNIQAGSVTLGTPSGTSKLAAGLIEGAGEITLLGDTSYNNQIIANIGSNIVVRAGTTGGVFLPQTVNNGTIASNLPAGIIELGSSLGAPTVPLTNNGTIQVSNGGTLRLSTNIINTNNISLSNAVVTTDFPNGYPQPTVLNSGQIILQGSKVNFGGSLTNSGLLQANNSTLTLGATWNNTGTISAYNSTLILGSATAIGSVNATASTFIAGCAFTPASFPMSANNIVVASRGAFNLSGSTITLGVDVQSLSLAGGNGSGASGTLTSGTIATPPGNSLKVSGTVFCLNMTFDGANLSLENAVLGFKYPTDLHGIGTFAGSATLVLNGAQDSNTIDGLDVFPAGSSIMTGTAAGTMGNSFPVSNKGLISARTPGHRLLVAGRDNSGRMEAVNGGTLALSFFSNSGVFYSGSNSGMTISGSFNATNSGTITADAGLIKFVGSPTTLGGTISASNGGTLDFSTSSISLTKPIVLANGNILFNASTSSAATITGLGNVSVPAVTRLTLDSLSGPTLTLNGTNTFRTTGSANAASLLSALTIAGTPNAWTGKLDLTNNALILQATDLADKAAKLPTLQNQLFSGYHNGDWKGLGITSGTVAANATTASPTLTLALADNSDLHYTSFKGQPTDDNSLIITQATFGDATLDGKVDSFDLNQLAAHWQQQQNALWSAGDFNNDGKVDSFDLNLLAANWQSATLLDAALSQLPFTNYQLQLPLPIPEPASALLLLPTLLFLRRASRQPSMHP